MSKLEDKSEKRKLKTTYSTLSSKNQITVPILIREKLYAEPGDKVDFNYHEETEEIIVM